MNWRPLTNLFYCLLLLILVFPAKSNIQDYRYRKAFKVQRLSLEQGLASSVVQDIIQDQQGYIWVATEDGLSRFDSYEFKNYRHDHKNKFSLHENWLVSLAEEPGKGVWVGTVSGVTFLNHDTQQFKNYSTEDTQLQAMITEITRLTTGELYFATENGLYFFDENNDAVVPFESSLGKKITSDVGSIGDTKDFIYVSSSDCLTRITKSSKALFNMCDLPSLEVLKGRYILKVLVVGDTIWLATNRGLFHYEISSDKLREFYHEPNNKDSLASNYVQDLALDGNGSLWIGSTVGLDYYNSDKESFEHYTQQDSSAEGLSAKDIGVLLIDKEKLLWLGTYGGGLNILNPNQHKFEHILTKSDVSNLGKDNTIHGIVKDRNHNLWMASYGGGLLKYDLLSGEISKPVQLSNSELVSHIYSLFIDHEHRLWLGGYDKLSIVNLDTEVELDTLVYVDGELIQKFDRPNQITQNYQGDIFIASEGGLFQLEKLEQTDGAVSVFLKNMTRELPVSLTNKTQVITAVIDDADGNLWIGSRAGLVYYQVDKNQYNYFVYESDNPQSITSNVIQVIYEDSYGFIWIGTSDGLNRVVRSSVDKDTFYFERITTYEGLPNNSIYGILEDQKRQLWISTNLGIVKYANGAVTSDTFRSVDGLSSDEFNTASYFSDAEGRLYFGSINGVTIINDVVSYTRENQNNLVFTHVQVGDRELDLFNLNNQTNPLIVQHSDENAIDISVANISYEKLGTQRYRYRIEGVNEKWVYLGTRRNIFIAGLPEGKYKVEVQTQMAGLPWANKSKLLNVVVETDFWSSSQANYLIGIIFLGVFAISILSISRYYKDLVERSQKKTTLEALRVKELRVDNESLKDELAEKAKSIQTLNRRVEIGEKKLDIEKYRDVSTGFYRLNYFYRLEGDDFLEEGADSGKGFDCYKCIAVFELKDYSEIFQNLGPLAVSEFVSQVSMVIRRNLNSRIQIFQIQSGIYLILGCEIEYQQFEDELLNLGHIIERFEVSVANGLSEHSRVSQTFMDVQKVSINSKRQLDVAIDLLIQLHQQLCLNRQEPNRRIILNTWVNPKELSKTSWRLEELLEQKIVDVTTL